MIKIVNSFTNVFQFTGCRYAIQFIKVWPKSNILLIWPFFQTINQYNIPLTKCQWSFAGNIDLKSKTRFFKLLKSRFTYRMVQCWKLKKNCKYSSLVFFKCCLWGQRVWLYKNMFWMREFCYFSIKCIMLFTNCANGIFKNIVKFKHN